MAKMIVNVPTDKMQSFVNAVVNLGIDSHAVISKRYKKLFSKQKELASSLRKISSSFILFDWEFFSNELEYE